MFRHNLLIAFRNIMRHKGSFFINLTGLSTGLACTFLIYLWVTDELKFDKFHKKDSQLYQVMEKSTENGQVIILEPYWDRQRFEIAAFCLQQTSLYFTALANGTSQMYSAEIFIKCIKEAGFDIVEETDHIGLSQTLIKCKKR